MQRRKPKTYWSPLAKRISAVLVVAVTLTYFQRDAVAFAEDKKEPFASLERQETVSEQLFAHMDTVSSDLMKMIEIPSLITAEKYEEPEPELTTVPAETTMAKEEVKEPIVVEEVKVPRYQVYDEDTMTWVLMPDANWECYLRDKAVDAGIEDYIPVLMIQLWEESRFKPDAVSAGGDHGLAQINHCNHARLKKALGITDFLDPYQSIDCQIYMMAPAIKEHGIYQALSLYNTGKIIEHTPYSDNIMRQYNADYCVLSSSY